MAFNGTEGGMISLQEAAGLTANYRAAHAGQVLASFYGKDHIQALLNQTGAMGIRIYYGIDNQGEKQMVLVAADANGNDILGLTLEQGYPCPKYCSSLNELNGSTGR